MFDRQSEESLLMIRVRRARPYSLDGHFRAFIHYQSPLDRAFITYGSEKLSRDAERILQKAQRRDYMDEVKRTIAERALGIVRLEYLLSTTEIHTRY